jgi:hypothetical protein
VMLSYQAEGSLKASILKLLSWGDWLLEHQSILGEGPNEGWSKSPEFYITNHWEDIGKIGQDQSTV